MDGLFLRFYLREGDRVNGRLAWEWLLEQAKAIGVRGGSAFRAIAGFGRHRVLHEERFFELAGAITVEVEFIVTASEATQLLDLVAKENLRAVYARIPAEFGVTGTQP
jgi:PII-like signaling protein